MKNPVQPLDGSVIDNIVSRCITEDIGSGDVTTLATITDSQQGAATMVAREALVVCGTALAARSFEHMATHYAQRLSCSILKNDGEYVSSGEAILRVEGNMRAILTAERTALNLIQHASAIATHTKRFCGAIAHTQVIVLDTRKTTPGLRALDKYAVRCGGGTNHRMRLDDGIMIKDNHIAASGSLSEAVSRMASSTLPIEVECDTLEQVKEAVAAGVDRILLDNMPADIITEALKLRQGAITFEASGGITLETIAEIAETGVDYISIGALTHSAPSVDMGLDYDA